MKVLYLLSALDFLNLAVYLPVFSAFVRSLGGTPMTLGLINSSSALISLLWNPIVGSLSDQIGRRGLLIKCMIASLMSSLLLAYPYPTLLHVFVAKLIAGFGAGVSTLIRAIVADTYKSNEGKKEFFNKCAPLISIAFLSGSLLGGFLSEAKHGYSLVFLLMACIMGTASVTARKLPDDTKSEPKKKQQLSFFQKFVAELKNAIVNIKNISWPRYKDLFIIKGFYDFSFAIIISNVGLIMLNDFGIKGRSIGYVFTMTSIFNIVSNLLKLKLHKQFAKTPDNVKIIGASIVIFCSYLGLSVASSIYFFLAMMATMVMSKAFLDTTLSEIVTTKTQKDDKGRVISAFDNLYPFALFLAPALSGLVAEVLGQRIVVGLATLPISVTIWVSYRQK